MYLLEFLLFIEISSNLLKKKLKNTFDTDQLKVSLPCHNHIDLKLKI